MHTANAVLQVVADAAEFEPDMLRIAKQLWQQKQTGVVDVALLKKTAKQLREGLMQGYDTNPTEPNPSITNKLKNNVYVFSGFKTHQTLKEASKLLVDENGNQRSFADFKAEILKLNNTYNVNYLRAEYDHATKCGTMASQWQNIQKNKKVLPYLQFDATLDNRTTTICRPLDGVILPVDDEFWKTHYLPLHWGERSVIRQLASGAVTDKNTIQIPELQPMFNNNVGISGVAFPKKHPYYKQVTKDAAELITKTATLAEINDVRKEVRSWAKTNINEHGTKIKVESKQFDELTLKRIDVKTITGKPHENAAAAYNAVMNVANLFLNAKYLGSSPDVKTNQTNYHTTVVKWLYYEVLIAGKKSYLNVMQLFNGDYRLHSISDEQGFDKTKITKKK